MEKVEKKGSVSMFHRDSMLDRYAYGDGGWGWGGAGIGRGGGRVC